MILVSTVLTKTGVMFVGETKLASEFDVCLSVHLCTSVEKKAS